MKNEEFIQISARGNFIIGLTFRGEIFFRTGVDQYHKVGTGWQKIDGVLKEVAAADGIIMGLNKKDGLPEIE